MKQMTQLRHFWTLGLLACLLALMSGGWAQAQTTIVANDFAGASATNLSAYSGATGGPWTAVTTNSGGIHNIQLDGSGGVYNSDTAGTEAVYLASDSVPTTGVTTITSSLIVRSEVVSTEASLVFSDTSGHLYQLAYYYDGTATSQIAIQRVAGGGTTATILRAQTNLLLSVGSHTLTFAYNAANATFSATMDGSAPFAAIVDSTYTPTRVGVEFQNITGVSTATTGNHLGAFNAINTTIGTATSYTLTGPGGGPSLQSSASFTLTPNGTTIGTFTPTVSGVTGSFTPSSVTNPSGPTTFTLNATSVGLATVGVTNTAGLSNPASLPYLAYPCSETDLTEPASGQAVTVFVPNALATAGAYNSANPTPLVQWFHGAGGGVQGAGLSDFTVPSPSGGWYALSALLNAGYIVALSNAHGDNWGNQASLDDNLALNNYVKANYNVSKTCFWAGSMGGLDATLCLSGNRIPNVVALAAVYPVTSLSALYNGTGGYNFSSAINTAYGITGSGVKTYANLTAGHDPLLKWGWAFRRVPVEIWASPSDAVVGKTQNADALKTLLNSSCSISVNTSTGNHGDDSNFQPSALVSFFNAAVANPTPTSGTTTTTTAIFQPRRGR